jgi:hypothetical protein
VEGDKGRRGGKVAGEEGERGVQSSSKDDVEAKRGREGGRDGGRGGEDGGREGGKVSTRAVPCCVREDSKRGRCRERTEGR